MATRNRFDPAPDLRPAGKVFSSGDVASECFRTQEAPETPPQMRKYRKSRLGQPGVRVNHWGTAEDRRDDAETRRFGIQTVTTEDHNVLGAQPQSRVGQFLNERKEAIYDSSKTEPLGKTHNKFFVPEKVRDQTFGKPTASSESTKVLLFPKDSAYLSGELDNDPEVKKLYVKSHGMWEPGEQRTREYNWKGINPEQHRFGARDKEDYREGVKKALNPAAEFSSGVPPTQFMPARVEAFRRAHADELGKVRNAGAGKPAHLSEDHSFGMPSVKFEDWGARECMQGAYGPNQQQPDPDLGRTVLRGCAPRHLLEPTSQRVFGVPSVRDDIKAPARRSVADGQNYGNEPNAKELLYPAPYAIRGVNEEDFMKPVSKAHLQELMESSGVLTGESFDRVWNSLTAHDDETVSIDTFRRRMMAMMMNEEL